MNENNLQKNSEIKNQVLEKIKSGEVLMKSRWHFVFKAVALVLLATLIFLVSVFLVSYVLFSVVASGHLFLLGFGTRGITRFVLSFPWLLLLADCILLLAFDYMLKNFRFGYHRPVVYLFIGTFAVIVVCGYVVEVTPLHKNILRKAENSSLPLVGGFYEGIRKSHSGGEVFRGAVVSIEGNTFMLQHRDYDGDRVEGVIKVIAPVNIDVRSILQIGDSIFVAGSVVNNEVRAYGIRKLNSDD